MSTNDATTSEQTTAKSGTGRKLIGCVAVFLVVGCILFAGLGYLITRVGDRVDDGLAAMAEGDCATAINHFDEVIGNTWASEEDEAAASDNKRLCQQFQDLQAQRAAGDLSGALVGYEDLLLNNSTSVLVPTIEQQVQTVFNEDPAQLVSVPVCQRLDSYLERNWIPNLDTNLPVFYQGCGDIFTGTADYTQAVRMYERFTVAYPNHPAFEEVEAAMAQAAVAEARQAGAGTIAPPQSVGGSGSGPAVVVIQNDSREEISLVFSGPEARFETLEPCTTCIDYTVAPEFCPEEGPIGQYEVPAGTYEVVVKSISDEGVIPFTGTWELGAGEEYYSCFFLISE